MKGNWVESDLFGVTPEQGDFLDAELLFMQDWMIWKTTLVKLHQNF